MEDGNMRTVNKEILNKKINALEDAGVCEKGIEAVRELVSELIGQPLIYHVGQWFRNKHEMIGLLAQTGYGFSQFILVTEDRDANRLAEPVKCSCFAITQDEFDRMVGNHNIYGVPSDWRLIESPVKFAGNRERVTVAR